LRVGGHNFPKESTIDNTVDAYIEFRKSFNQFLNITHPSLSYADFIANKNVIGLDLEVIPSASGSGISSMQNFLQLHIECSDGGGVLASQLNVFLLYSKILEIFPNKIIGIQE
jgi:hypothetical protein